MNAFKHFGAYNGRPRATTTGGPGCVGGNMARKFVETGGVEATIL